MYSYPVSNSKHRFGFFWKVDGECGRGFGYISKWIFHLKNKIDGNNFFEFINHFIMRTVRTKKAATTTTNE